MKEKNIWYLFRQKSKNEEIRKKTNKKTVKWIMLIVWGEKDELNEM